jgi:hypothetical protein
MNDVAAVGRRSRFSLLTLILVMTIAAMGVGLWRLGREIVPMRRELQTLRAETGHLTIEDPSLIYAIAIPTMEKDVFRWRISLPRGKRLYLHCQPYDVPKSGVPPRPNPLGGSEMVGEGQFRYECRIQFDPRNPEQLIARIGGRNETQVYGTEVKLNERREDWIENEITGRRTDSGGGLGLDQISGSVDEPFVLLRMRAQKVVVKRDAQGKRTGWSFEQIDEPTDGLMIWIDQYEH